MPLFLNARTDLFLKEKDADKHPSLVEEALARQSAYADANVMMMGANTNSIKEAAKLGVSRISFGPGPYMEAMGDLKAKFTSL